ncbi:MAG TPA: holo-ACP synthase [Acidimicrobiales bacterium]|nr:holo-ACP synthase [Acidimicrobiales bacterium]
MSEVLTPAWPKELVVRSVFGIGIDLASTAEVRESIREFGQRYLRRVFTDHELAYCGRSADPAPHLAARFAAKEATIKALRADGSQPPWTSIEVRADPGGWCRMRLYGAAQRLARQRGVSLLSVSLSHEGELAAAIVVATTDN